MGLDLFDYKFLIFMLVVIWDFRVVNSVLEKDLVGMRIVIIYNIENYFKILC